MSKQFVRLDTTKKDSDLKTTVDKKRQQIIGILAIRGEGKSFLLEALAEKEYYYDGYTVLDLHSPSNLENGFWCVPRLESDDEIVAFRKDPRPFLKTRKAIPVTIIGSETMIYTQEELDRYNQVPYTKEEFEKEFPDKIYNFVYPPEKPKNKQKELVRIVKIPLLTNKERSETNDKALEIIEKTILDCRAERRIFVLNRMCFPDERQYFWCQELIIRGLEDICNKHFIKKYPVEVGCKTREEMRPIDRNWHKGVILIRELADLAPARTKADKSGESTKVKKSLMLLNRIIRHIVFDVLEDWQKVKDVDDSVRGQVDKWCIKGYNTDLAGDEKSIIFKRIAKIRALIMKKGNYKKRARLKADTWFPKLDELTKKYYYLVVGSKQRLFKVPEMIHQHKEPDMKFHEITGIHITHDYSKVPQVSGSTKKVTSSSKKQLYETIVGFDKSNKKMSWADKLDELVKLQEKGEIDYPADFSTKDEGYIRATFGKLKKKYEK